MCIRDRYSTSPKTAVSAVSGEEAWNLEFIIAFEKKSKSRTESEEPASPAGALLPCVFPFKYVRELLEFLLLHFFSLRYTVETGLLLGEIFWR